jgi:hypothetical protein
MRIFARLTRLGIAFACRLPQDGAGDRGNNTVYRAHLEVAPLSDADSVLPGDTNNSHMAGLQGECRWLPLAKP